jgi:two-component system sensor histidine kinase UhpB
LTTGAVAERPSGAAEGRPGTVLGRPIALQFALDVAGILLCLATVAQLYRPDVVFQGVWIVLVLQAFAFGVRVTSVRIAIASIVVFGYSAIAHGNDTPLAAALGDLEVAEWPMMVVISAVVAIMADRVTATSRNYARLYRQASHRLLTAQEDERRRLALDIHDGIGQTITALTLTLDAAESMLWATDTAPSPQTRDAIGRAQELAAVALLETREVAGRLRPARIRETGLLAAITELVANAGRPVELRFDPGLVRPGILPIDTEAEMFRIVQEALGNALRHAKATTCWVDARIVAGQLCLEVGDDGIGFDRGMSIRRGLGLAGMEERATVIGAQLEIRSVRDRGSLVLLDIPLPELTVRQSSILDQVVLAESASA